MKRTLIRYLLLALSLFATSAQAVDFVVDEKPNEQLGNGYALQGNDVVGGYPIFQADGGWKLWTTEILSATGPQRSFPLPHVVLNRRHSGKWVMAQSVMVTLYSDGASMGWAGDPCSGDKIIKINRIRGRLDRCATAELITSSIDGKPADVLRIAFTETNNGGRFYSTTLFANIGFFGLSPATVTSSDSEFNKHLTTWMQTMLAAVVKAADYDKPLNAFDGVPPLSSVLKARGNSGNGSTVSGEVACPPSSSKTCLVSLPV